MTKADEYHRDAAECVALSQQRGNADDKARLVTMAQMWLRIAEVTEKQRVQTTRRLTKLYVDSQLVVG
jgi:hypothetical protein